MTILAGSLDDRARRRHARSVIGGVVLLLFVAGVVAASAWAVSTLRPPREPVTPPVVQAYGTPEATVEAYYAAVAAGDAAAGLVLVADAARGPLGEAAGSDFRNVVSLTAVVVEPSLVEPPPAAPSPSPSPAASAVSVVAPAAPALETVVVPVTFEAVYKHSINADSGPQKRLVSVARAGPGSPWRILAIGTAP